MGSFVLTLESYESEGAQEHIDELILRNGTGQSEYTSPLERIVVPENVHRIAKRALANHEELEEVILPTTLNVIERDAFVGSKNLRRIIIPIQ